MKNKTEKENPLVKIAEAGLLSLVASRLKGKVLFPEKVANAKKYLQSAKLSKS